MEGNVSMEEPSAARPLGLKKGKVKRKLKMDRNASPGVWIR